MNLDTACFKAFQSAAKTLNFTEAARLAGMTQSGVSQHISKLERELETELFRRVGKKVFLTEPGKNLLGFIERFQDSVSKLHEELQDSRLNLNGLVRYAMPESCLLSPHFSMLLKEKIKAYPQIELHVELHSSETVIDMVLNNQIDFGFTTKKLPNEDLSYTEFCSEEYVLVSATSEKENLQNLHEQHWIHYPDCETIFEEWKSQQPKSKKPESQLLQSKTNSINVALVMVAHGLGISVFSRHCVESSNFRSKMHIHTEGRKPCRNMIYIVSLKSAFQPRRVAAVIETFRQMKA